MARDIRTDPGVLTKPEEDFTAENAENAGMKAKNDTPAEGVDASASAQAITAGERKPVEELMAAAKLSRPLAAALMAHTRWGAGRKLTQTQFDAALAALRGKPAREV